jgi:hypothetical protein
MLSWMKKRGWTGEHPHEATAESGKPPPRAMSGKYVLLYKYLENRYATTVVLTFAEIEDLLGFSLPEEARLQPEWWTEVAPGDGPHYSDCWVLASRTATPNLPAQIVVFERAL